MVKVNIEINIDDLINTYSDRFVIPNDFANVLKNALNAPIINDDKPVGIITGYDDKMIYGQLWVEIQTQNTVKTTLGEEFKILLENLSAIVIKFRGDE